MGSNRPAPPLAVELSRSVMLACRRQPELARAVNSVLLRAARRLGTLSNTEQHVRVAGRAEGIVLDLRLTPPDGCHVEAVEQVSIDVSTDLTV